MTVAIACALATSFAYGVATVLQAIGARREARAAGVHPGLLVKLVRQGPFMAGLGLDAAGAVLAIVALRRLPLFVVQAAIAASLAVTALVAARLLHTRLSRAEWGAIGAVAVGLLLLTASAGAEAVPHTSLATRVVLLAGAAVIGLAALPAGRVHGTRGAVLLGALAGVAYGLANTALRVVRSFDPRHLVVDPAAGAAVVGAVLGVLLFATALQRGSVTGATGAMIAAETVLPALYGALVLGERARAGWEPVAIAGFVVTVAAATALARFGEAAAPQATST